MSLRNAMPDDYLPIITVLDSWWGGRHMSDMLPKLFFVHFHDTSFVIEENGEQLGFLIGFVSQAAPNEAYIHFVGVHPDHRQRGFGALLYERFFEVALARGCDTVKCVTSPVNTRSIAFHLRMGFAAEPGDADANGVPYTRNYDGPGEDRVKFKKAI